MRDDIGVKYMSLLSVPTDARGRPGTPAPGKEPRERAYAFNINKE